MLSDSDSAEQQKSRKQTWEYTGIFHEYIFIRFLNYKSGKEKKNVRWVHLGYFTQTVSVVAPYMAVLISVQCYIHDSSLY